MIRQSLSLIVLAAMLTLAGCGGGGSGNSTVYDLNSVETQFVQSSHHYSLTATDQGAFYALQLDTVPASSPPSAPVAACKGAAGVVKVDSTLAENNRVISAFTYYRYYRLSPYKILCDYNPTTGQVSIYANQEALPTAATVGDSGPMDIQTTFTDTGLGSVSSTGTDTWALASTNGSPQLCLNAVTTESDGSGTGSELDCFAINASGKTSTFTLTLVSGSTTLDFH